MKLSFSDISQKDIPGVLITLLFLCIYVSGIWYIKHLEKTVHAQAVELAAETTREASLRSLSGFLADLSSDENQLSSFFVAPEDAVGVIEDIEGLEALTGATVSIGGVHIEDENAETGEGAMVMNISAEGTWKQVSKLLALLDEFPKASFIDTAMFVRGERGEEDSQQVWSLRVTMRVFLRK